MSYLLFWQSSWQSRRLSENHSFLQLFRCPFIHLFVQIFVQRVKTTLFEIYHLSEMSPGSASWYHDSNYPSFHLYDPAEVILIHLADTMVLVVLVITSMRLSFSHQSLTSWVQRCISWIIWCWVEKAASQRSQLTVVCVKIGLRVGVCESTDKGWVHHAEDVGVEKEDDLWAECCQTRTPECSEGRRKET